MRAVSKQNEPYTDYLIIWNDRGQATALDFHIMEAATAAEATAYAWDVARGNLPHPKRPMAWGEYGRGWTPYAPSVAITVLPMAADLFDAIEEAREEARNEC